MIKVEVYGYSEVYLEEYISKTFNKNRQEGVFLRKYLIFDWVLNTALILLIDSYALFSFITQLLQYSFLYIPKLFFVLIKLHVILLKFSLTPSFHNGGRYHIESNGLVFI